ncbi:MAG: 4Fe-4S dicluster domain-containing protein [Bacteroides sp.]|nr:MAG: 4Fe-4S dicluster domain-containing protein [Bacteroides sp.]
MSIKITNECINCGACEPECPNNAIYEGNISWNYSKGTSLSSINDSINGNKIDCDVMHNPISNDLYYIVPEKCTECVGFHEEPQCAAVCPVDCCIKDNNNIETKDYLLSKKKWMHNK